MGNFPNEGIVFTEHKVIANENSFKTEFPIWFFKHWPTG